jgi:hypothetical protein
MDTHAFGVNLLIKGRTEVSCDIDWKNGMFFNTILFIINLSFARGTRLDLVVGLD